jgi:hypothetical protein
LHFRPVFDAGKINMDFPFRRVKSKARRSKTRLGTKRPVENQTSIGAMR